MDFSWTTEQEALRQRALDFLRNNLNGDLRTRDEQGIFPMDHWRACAKFGILGSFVPKQYGGQGWDIVTSIMLMETVGYGCRDNGFTLGLNGQMWSIQEPILRFGNEVQKKNIYPCCVRAR